MYKYSFGHRYLNISKYKDDRQIIFDIENISGVINIEIINKETQEIEVLDNPKTGQYIIDLKKDHSYKVIVITNKAVGKYKITLKTII